MKPLSCWQTFRFSPFGCCHGYCRKCWADSLYVSPYTCVQVLYLVVWERDFWVSYFWKTNFWFFWQSNLFIHSINIDWKSKMGQKQSQALEGNKESLPPHGFTVYLGQETLKKSLKVCMYYTDVLHRCFHKNMEH